MQGEVEQYQALGVSRELREKGYALMCVAYPLSDCKMETVPEDEVYELQFGKAFAAQVTSWLDAQTNGACLDHHCMLLIRLPLHVGHKPLIKLNRKGRLCSGDCKHG